MPTGRTGSTGPSRTCVPIGSGSSRARRAPAPWTRRVRIVKTFRSALPTAIERETVMGLRALEGKIGLVAGATRGAGRGIAVELGAAGATVYCTGRTTRAQRSEYNRPETIGKTAELVQRAGGTGIAMQVDHLEPAQVEALVAR